MNGSSDDVLDRLCVIAARDRLINNTPYDVYKILGAWERQGERVSCIDLRLALREDELPASRDAYLFLETAGTWMCFDWDVPRFREAIARLRGRAARLTLVGPQAPALRDRLGLDLPVVDDLDVSGPLLADAVSRPVPLSPRWALTAAEDRYNGEYYDGSAYTLAPTFSVYHRMTCPLSCSFCYYSRHAPRTKIGLDEFLGDLTIAQAMGHVHFYFMDPNLILSAAAYERLAGWHEGRQFSYYCQVSPNFLNDEVLSRLRRSGCRGMVIGVENEDLIRSKCRLEELDGILARVRDHGMLPMLFYMIDGEHDVRPLAARFAGYPFRYSVLNRAFAGDLSLASIERGFEAKRRLADVSRAILEELRAAPGFLEHLATPRHEDRSPSSLEAQDAREARILAPARA